MAFKEPNQSREHVLWRRRASKHACVDAGNLHNAWRGAESRIDQCRKGFIQTTVPIAEGGDLDDTIIDRTDPCRLEIENDDGLGLKQRVGHPVLLQLQLMSATFNRD